MFMTHLKTYLSNLFLMQEEASSLSFIQFSEDQRLNQLFQNMENNQDFSFHHDNFVQNVKDSKEAQDISLDEQALQKGYQSEIGGRHRPQNKRIKKKKPIFADRQYEAKRRRVKLYIQTLENRVDELQTENTKLKKLNQLNISYIKKLSDSQHVINGFFIDRQKLFDRLDKLISEENPDISKIKMQCQTLIQRQGAYGKQRIKAVNYYFKQLLHMMLPNIQKYITEAAFNQTDIFSPNYRSNQNQDDKLQFIGRIKLSDEVVQRLVQKKGEIVDLKKKFNEKVLEMYTNKCQLLKILRDVERICQNFGESVSVLGKARFLCYAESHKQDEGLYAPSVKKMYEQLDSCSRFSYSNEMNSNGISTSQLLFGYPAR